MSSKKSAMPPADDLKRVIEEAIVPQGVCDGGDRGYVGEGVTRPSLV